ncbi:hypothetical protein [Campylobacter avium]|uniref:hypothetical protein n=1 Tax=Campylobacter avium TaxID=522485 RepID=UPI00255C1836|nr:hypothetical protein [Campylobacter avium]
MASIEEIIEDNAKEQLRNLGISYFTKTQNINTQIESPQKIPKQKGRRGRQSPRHKTFLAR